MSDQPAPNANPDPQINLGNVQGNVEGNIAAGGNVTLETKIENRFDSLTSARFERNRQAMLTKVRETWVEGVLTQSLHGAELVAVGLERRAEAVYPWGVEVEQGDHPRQRLDPGTSLLSVFEQAGRRLLILGAPGAGKTTMLLELARQLLAQAETGPGLIPVVFNLASWAQNEPPLEEWLVEELAIKYYVPRKIGRAWVEGGHLLLLLDGLDEVKPSRQAACAQEINAFIDRAKPRLALCSRTAEYESLGVRLRLGSAIHLLPLTSAQIEAYLARRDLAAVREMLDVHHDPAFQELTQSPLMLSIISLAYRGKSVAELGRFETVAARQQHLFATYVEEMLTREVLYPDPALPVLERRERVQQKEKPYSDEDTKRWLAWLAERMSKHNQSIFLNESIKPSWLQTPKQLWFYTILSRTVIGLLIGLLTGLISATILVEIIAYLTRTAPLMSDLPFTGLYFRIIVFAFFVIGGAVIGATLGIIKHKEITKEQIATVEALEWSLEAIRSEVKSRIVIWRHKFKGGRQHSVIAYTNLTISVANALERGVHSRSVKEKNEFNQGIWQSLKNALIVTMVSVLYGLIYGPFVGLAIVLAFIVTTIGSSNSLQLFRDFIGFGYSFYISGIAGIFLAVIFSFKNGLKFGGFAFIQHFTLRFVMRLSDNIFWNPESLLDYAVDRLLLRKIGGGYIFVHRSLLEYLVSVGPEIGHHSSFVEQNPKNFKAYLDRGNACYELGYWSQAIKDYLKAIDLHPEGVDAHIGLARAYHASDNLTRAISIYSSVTELRPANPQLYYELGNVLNEAGYIEDAIKNYNKVINLDPDNIAVHSILNEFYRTSNQLAKGVFIYTKAIETNPKHKLLYYIRGKLYHDLGSLKEAISDYTYAIKLGEKDSMLFYLRGNAHYEAKNFQQAVRDCKKAVQLMPTNRLFLLTLANFHHALGDLKLAIRRYDEVLILSPKDAEVYVSKGKVYYDYDNPERAIYNFTEAIKVNPEYSEAYHELGGVYHDTAKFHDFENHLKLAISNYTQAILLSPDDPRIYHDRGLAYHDSGNKKEAIIDYEKVIELDPNNVDTYYNRGLAYQETNQMEQAISDFEKYLELKPDASDRMQVTKIINDLKQKISDDKIDGE